MLNLENYICLENVFIFHLSNLSHNIFHKENIQITLNTLNYVRSLLKKVYFHKCVEEKSIKP